MGGRRGWGPADEALVTAIVEMARGLSLRVVAEGVEREEQVAFLRSRGCRIAQGFLFSRPLPPDEALAVVLGSKAGTGKGGAGGANLASPGEMTDDTPPDQG